MVDVVAFVSLNFHFFIPPLLGAFIGYLTNKIAIKMLFRPLKAWRIFGIRIPMTPGVIPAKRQELAQNFGEVVGGHLLTSKEIGAALQKKSFQNQLGELIHSRVGGIFRRQLPTLPELIPDKYKSYFDIGKKTIAYQVKLFFHKFMATEKFEKAIVQAVNAGSNEFLHKDIDSIVTLERREHLYASLEVLIKNMFTSKAMEHWLEDYIFGTISDTLKNKKSLVQVLPESILELIFHTVEAKTPDLLARLVTLIKEPEIQEKIVKGVKKGVDGFVETLGPMGGMVQNFLNIETLEKVIKDYLRDNEENIARTLEDEEIRKKVVHVLSNRVRHFLDTPIADYLQQSTTVNIDHLSKSISLHILVLLRKEAVATTVSTMLKENIEIYLEGGNRTLEEIIVDMAGQGGHDQLRGWVAKESVDLLRSPMAKKLIDLSVDQLITSLLRKPVGKISDFIPAGVRRGIYASTQNMASAMLAAEVPGLVDSLNIKQIIIEKIDSLDLLKLERLLLSIMEEQFKYINLFGALLGFLIGSLNLVILLLR